MPGALRRSELVCLDAEHLRPTPLGIRLLIARSKTDKTGEGVEIPIARGSTAETCPVRAVRAWLKATEIVDGPILWRATHRLRQLCKAVAVLRSLRPLETGSGTGGEEPCLRRKALDIILESFGRNSYLEHFGQRVISGQIDSGITLGLLHKDVRLATQLGVDSGLTVLFGNLVREFDQMCINPMARDTQVNGAALFMDRISGTQVLPPDHTI